MIRPRSAHYGETRVQELPMSMRDDQTLDFTRNLDLESINVDAVEVGTVYWSERRTRKKSKR